MKTIYAVPAGSLSQEQLTAWAQIQSERELLASPYLSPEFTQAVAHVRSDVEVAVVEEEGQPVGFLPFQRTPWNGGRAAGGWLSNYQALIARPEVIVHPVDLLRGCQLSSWKFDHLVGLPETFSPYVARYCESYYVDLADGYDVFATWLKQRGKALAECERKYRKMGREVGPLRFEPRSHDPSVLNTLIDWKSAHYRRTRERNVFQSPWVCDLLHHILDSTDDRFSPLLSVLYTGDQIAAISYALRARGALHGWFMAYNPELAKYSPGTQMLVEIFKYAPAAGIRRFDLGKGPEPYKRQFTTGHNRVAEGVVDVGAARGLMRRAMWRARDFVRESPLKSPAHLPVQMFRQARGWIEMR